MAPHVSIVLLLHCRTKNPEGQAWCGILNVLSSYIKQILLSAEITFDYDGYEPDQPRKGTGKGLKQLSRRHCTWKREAVQLLRQRKTQDLESGAGAFNHQEANG